MAGQPPVPEHSKLIHYNSRRTAHLIKLCMVASADRSNDLRISLEDYQRAHNWLLEVEAVMVDIFKSMAQGGDSRAIEDTWHFIWAAYSKGKKPISSHIIVRFLAERVPSYNVPRVIETMVSANFIRVVARDVMGNPLYEPTPKSTNQPIIP
jgi:hypothetical protein